MGSERGGLANHRDEPGFQEQLEFFETPDGALLFGVAHLPTRDIVGSVVIVPPMFTEGMKNYRREVLLARALASQGIAVQRFHYRGTGNSYGSGSELVFDLMIQDVLGAARWLENRVGSTNIALTGTRAAAMVAAAAARDLKHAPLAVWDPVLDADAWFREIFRARLVGRLKQGSTSASKRDPRSELAETGMLDLLGYPINREFHQSMAGRTLVAELAVPLALLLVQFGGDGPRREYSAVEEELEHQGAEVEVRAVGEREAWWFGGTAWLDEMEVAVASRELIDITAMWLRRALAVTGSSR